MARIRPLAAAMLGALAVVLAACTAEVDEGCVAGPCGNDAGLENPTGAGGTVENCFASPVKIEECGDKQPPLTGDIPCDVFKVLDKDPVESGGCHDCHRSPPRNGAPFPLLTYEDLQETFAAGPLRRYQHMLQVIQLEDDPATEALEALPHMPFLDAPQLSCDDARTLSTWLAACAPPDDEGSLERGCCSPKTCADLASTCGKTWDGCGSYIVCDDATLNGGETDVDCGGDSSACLTRCGEGQACVADGDCDTIVEGEESIRLGCDRISSTCERPE